MKLLLESWREFLAEQSQPVDLRFPDVIPQELLALADNDPEIGGFVFADNDPEIGGFVYPREDRQRAGIYLDDELVGFMTPREEDGGWRVGAIYIRPENRGKGIAPSAIAKFFEDKNASPVPIGLANSSSQSAFAKAGFVLLDPDDVLTDEKDGWEYQLWGREEA